MAKTLIFGFFLLAATIGLTPITQAAEPTPAIMSRVKPGKIAQPSDADIYNFIKKVEDVYIKIDGDQSSVSKSKLCDRIYNNAFARLREVGVQLHKCDEYREDLSGDSSLIWEFKFQRTDYTEAGKLFFHISSASYVYKQHPLRSIAPKLLNLGAFDEPTEKNKELISEVISEKAETDFNKIVNLFLFGEKY